jgi:hypothetical protein
MLQLSNRDISDPSEETNLMVNEKESRVLRREPLKGLASPRLKIRPLQPAPSPLAVGIAYSKKFRSAATNNFIDASRLAQAG